MRNILGSRVEDERKVHQKEASGERAASGNDILWVVFLEGKTFMHDVRSCSEITPHSTCGEKVLGLEGGKIVREEKKEAMCADVGTPSELDSL